MSKQNQNVNLRGRHHWIVNAIQNEQKKLYLTTSDKKEYKFASTFWLRSAAMLFFSLLLTSQAQQKKND